MPRIDDFTSAVKIELANRAGYKCSFLGCGAATMGPSAESESSSTNSGMACHISAASAGIGARRYDPDMKSDERKSASNGIWMCYTHGKIIDTDETRFSTDTLRAWKKIAEIVAQLMVERNLTYEQALHAAKSKDMITDSILIEGIGKENILIGDVLHDCGVEYIWGRDITNAIRDFLVEHSRNAFQHGNATKIEFKTKKSKLILIDDGVQFDGKSLLGSNKKSGGTISITQLLKNFGSNLILISEREGNNNILTISKLSNPEDVLEITPCSHQMDYSDFRKGSIEFEISETCKELFIVFPKYISPSDIGLLGNKLIGLEEKGKKLIFVMWRMNPWIIQMLKENYPGCEVIQVE
ncbi:hypothetical protein HKT18_04985 [Flavobacterium sp. IMCC34852]|uniref:Uncharacterized protein n=1 Tax=Flavobacterium rivulicola TaxID=2732161 RepID=A0A7Y3VYD3_9FLAO|nr:hypothetical protein [Flavobacterium sp. IMCC34852]NNT71568.1 hypothetical protein [Flavobacterium sp. IMCC34852]